MHKNYFLDTSVLIHSPSALFAFEDNFVCITRHIIDQLRTLRDRPGEVGHNAKESLRLIAEYGEKKTEGRGTICLIRSTYTSDSYLKTVENYNGIVVTLDDAMRADCKIRGVHVQTYKNNSVKRELRYAGRCHIYTPSELFTSFAAGTPITPSPSLSFCNPNNTEQLPNYTLTANEFIALHDAAEPSQILYGRFDAATGEIVPLRYYKNKNREVFGIHAKNDGQVFALEALMAPAEIAPLVILKGPAGTAKTFLALAAAMEQTFHNPTYQGIIVSRPNVQFDADIGFLPGAEREKIAPLNRPISDNISNLLSNQKKENYHKTDKRNKTDNKKETLDKLQDNAETTLLNNQQISTESMSYMRGRSICNKFIFIDEAQNATPSQIVGMITRPGENTKIVLVGDPDQIDNKYLDHTNNGLVVAAEAMRGSPLCWQVTFDSDECLRSKLAAEAIRRFGPQSKLF